MLVDLGMADVYEPIVAVAATPRVLASIYRIRIGRDDDRLAEGPGG
jgi:hypothetical protein